MKLKKTLICLTVAAVLSGCGGSNDSQPDITVPDTTVIRGLAIKGILSNAQITAFKYVDGKPVALSEAEIEGSSMTTDDKGRYQITLVNYDGPVKIEISPSTDKSNPTYMLCDAPAGCGDVQFGDEINLTANDPEFKLSAISMVDKASQEPLKLNISAVTHLATGLIESKPTIDASTVATTLSEVGNALGIIGDINTLEPTNTNDADAVAAEDNANELRYGLINSGIASSMFSGEATTGAVMSVKLAQAVSDLVESDGAFMVAADDDDAQFEMAIADILRGAAEIATQLSADNTLTEQSALMDQLKQIIVNFDHEVSLKTELAGDDGRIVPVSDKVTTGGAVEVAAGLVDDLRVFANLFDLTKSSGADVNTQGSAYIELTNKAALMLEAEKDSFSLLSEISAAIAAIELINETSDNPAITYTLEQFRAEGSTSIATGILKYDPANYEFTISAADGANTAELNASAVIATDNKSIDVTLNGFIESPAAKLALEETSFVKINFGQEISEELLKAEDNDIIPQSGELLLDVSLVQKASATVSNPMSFVGKINTKLVAIDTPQVRNNYWYDSFEVVNEPELIPEIFTLSGELASSDSNSIKVVFTVAAPDAATYEAAGLEVVGKIIPQNFTITAKLDGTVTEVMTDAYTSTQTYTAGSEPGEWASEYIEEAVTPEISWYGAKMTSNTYSRIIDNPLGKEYLFTRTFNSDKNYSGYSIKLTPTDTDGNDTVDQYVATQIWVGYDHATQPDIAILNSDHQLLNQDRSVKSFADGWSESFDSLEAYFQSDFAFIGVVPEQITSALDLTKNNWNGYGGAYGNIADVGEVTVKEPKLINGLTKGNSLILDSYVSRPLFNDAIEVVLGNSGNDVAITIAGQLEQQWQFTATSTEPANFVVNYTGEHGWDTMQLTSSTTAVDLINDNPKLTLQYQYSYFVELRTYTPIDSDGDKLTDSYQECSGWGDSLDSAGKLVSSQPPATDQNEDGLYCYTYFATSLNDDFSYIGGAAFNPFTLTSAVQLFKTGNTDYIGGYVDEIGYLSHQLTEDEREKIAALGTADTTLTFDANLQEVDEVSGLESDTQYLKANAALSVNVVLGDYNVQLAIAATRTAREAATFDLTATYKVPSESTQRTFVISYDSEQQEQVIITNEEGSSITLVPSPESTDTDSAQQVLGVIMVGDEQAAQVVSRDNAVLIIYSNGVVESI